MKKINQLLLGWALIFAFMAIGSCNEKKDTHMNALNQAYTFNQTKVLPDSSLDIDIFNHQFSLNPERWKKAFDFLEKQDLDELKEGTIELEGENLFVKIQEYNTKNPTDCQYESHTKYADIQYLVKGSEQIGVIQSDKGEVLEPYDAGNDIAFYRSAGLENYRIADSSIFFIFFPDDLHKPCVQIVESEPVKKIVIKVRLD